MDYAPPWTPQQSYKFTGTLNDPGEPHQVKSFFVLAGVGAPTVAGGYAKINIVDRPRRKGFTNPAGYDPMSMTVPVRFEATDDYGSFSWSPRQIELNIEVLEWMAGRGKLYGNGTHPASGTPPIVQVGSFKSGSGISTNLIPPSVRSDGAPPDLRWLISNLQWEAGALRNRLGYRIRQDATVTLTEYVASPGAVQSPRQRQQGRGKSSGFKTFRTTAATDTIARLCIAHGITRASDWSKVVAFNRARTHIRSYNQTLKHGTKIEIPDSLFTG